MTALQLIRLLRPVLPGATLQHHLTDCAVYELVDRGLKPWLPHLSKRHVLGLRPLPSPDRRQTILAEGVREGIQ